MLEIVRKIQNLNLDQHIDGILNDHVVGGDVRKWYATLDDDVQEEFSLEKALSIIIKHMLVHDIMDRRFEFYRIESIIRREEWSWFERIVYLSLQDDWDVSI